MFVYPLQLALDYGIKFMETSAKANINVENVSPWLQGDMGLWGLWDQCWGLRGLSLGDSAWRIRGTGLWLRGPSPVLLMGPLQCLLLDIQGTLKPTQEIARSPSSQPHCEFTAPVL